MPERKFGMNSIGRAAPTALDEPMVKGIDGLYENLDPNSDIRYVIDEAKFGSAKLKNTRDGLQMSDGRLKGSKTGTVVQSGCKFLGRCQLAG